MYYTLLHLPSGTEVYNRSSVYESSRDKYGLMRHTRVGEVDKLLTFNNIREVRNHINSHRFYEDPKGIILDSAMYPTVKKVSKHTLEPKRYEDV
jgi:hypothetical protein